MNTAGFVVAQTASAGGISSSSGTANLTTGTWQHVAGVFESDTHRVAYLDGTADTPETTSRAPSGIDAVTMCAGIFSTSSYSRYVNADMAEWGVWNVALTAGEIAMLAAGYSPLMVRPDALVAYWDVVGKNSPETDIVGQYNLTLTGTSASPHPRIIRPSAKILTFPTTGGASLNVSATTDALTLAEYAATIGKAINVSATTDALTLAEYAATVSLSRDVSATTDALTLAEYAATIGLDLNISAGVDALTLAEYAATVGGVTDISATTDALTLAEYAATIGLDLNIAATTDALTLAEYPATLGSTQNVQATTDALTLAEYPATIGLALNIAATTDALTLVEYGATISDADAVTTTTTQGGGIGHGKKRKKRVMVDGYVYVVDPDQERALLARLAQEKAQEAQLLAALGDTETAAEVRRKAFRIARRADMADPYERIRQDDDEILNRFAALLAA